MILIDKKMDGKKQRELGGLLRMKFHDYCSDQPFDIIIKYEKDFEKEKDTLNTISSIVYQCGVEI